MVNENRAEFDKATVFETCEGAGEAAVLADLERSATIFASKVQQFIAWEWVYQQRINREQSTEKALREAARQTMFVARATGLVALVTAALAMVEIFARN